MTGRSATSTSGARTWTDVLVPLTDPDFFAQVTFDHKAATISWPGGLDMAPEALYEETGKDPL